MPSLLCPPVLSRFDKKKKRRREDMISPRFSTGTERDPTPRNPLPLAWSPLCERHDAVPVTAVRKQMTPQKRHLRNDTSETTPQKRHRKNDNAKTAPQKRHHKNRIAETIPQKRHPKNAPQKQRLGNGAAGYRGDVRHSSRKRRLHKISLCTAETPLRHIDCPETPSSRTPTFLHKKPSGKRLPLGQSMKHKKGII